MYVAMPFQWPDGKVVYEAQGGVVMPGQNQLPGSSSDWQGVQSFVAVRSPQGQIICGSDQIPLVQLGDLNGGKWQPVTVIERPYVYSWVMNNYWYTNFRASQEGEFRWSYYLTSTRDASNAAASRFGWGSRVPLAARVLPPGKAGGGKLSDSLLKCDAGNLLLIESRPAARGKGVVLHWREVDGKKATLDLAGQPFAARIKRADEVNVVEETLKAGISSLSFEPYEVKFVKLVSD
jgi:alpha-mannosidase